MPPAPPATSLVIRPLASGDVPTVAAFNVAMARETEALQLDLETVTRGVRALLEDPAKGFYRVAELDGRVVGQLMVTFEWSDWRCGFWWWIQSVYVSPSARRRGVYRQLYEAVLAESKGHGDVRGLRLYVEKDNAVAQDTYRALGMQPGKYLVFETASE